MSIGKYRYPAPKGNGKPVIIDGLRTPFVKSFGVFEDCDTLELYSRVIDGLLRKISLDPEHLDEVIAGAVIPQTKNPNVARDSILNLGLPKHVHGYTVNRACTSSLQTISDATKTIAYGHPNIILAGGVECLSDVPIVYSREARKMLFKLNKAKTTGARISILTSKPAKNWLPQKPQLAEPKTGLTMGQHAEIMAQKNEISREEQDVFAAASHAKASAAQEAGLLSEEIIPIWPSPGYSDCITADNIIRADSTAEALAKLRPAFDKKYGTLTAGNSSPLTDGASVTLIADEHRALAAGLKPRAEIVDMDFVAIDPSDQLLIGPAVTIPRILHRNGLKLEDIGRFEIHEAFAAQVLSCIKSMADDKFCESYFGSTKAFGEIPEDILNVNGGAIAIGHPFGATGSRLVNSMVNELHRSGKELGVIAICAAGGMAGSMIIRALSK